MMSLMDEVPRGELQSRTHWRRSPLGREGLAILALRKLNRQPYFFRPCAVTIPLGALGSCTPNLLPSTVLHRVC
jgi:hypothetical protein